MNYKRLLRIESNDGQAPTRINVLNAGEFKTTKYGLLSVTTEMLRDMVKNFNENTVRAGDTPMLPIDAEHYSDQGAYGWMTALELSDNDTKLWADVDWTPWGSEALAGKIFKFFSPEFTDLYIDPENADIKTPNVLIGGGLTNRPLFKSLKPIMANEGQQEAVYLSEDTMEEEKKEETTTEETETKEEDTKEVEVEAQAQTEDAESKSVEAAENAGEEQSMEEEINEIRDAFTSWDMNPFKNLCWFNVKETHEDEGNKGYIIVEADPDFDGDSKLYKVMFTEDEATEKYVFELPVEVNAEYIEITASEAVAEHFKQAAELDSKKRDKLDDSDFAYIDSKGGRHLPINDAAHVRNALARINQTEFENEDDKEKAMKKIQSKAKELGIDVEEDEKDEKEASITDKKEEMEEKTEEKEEQDEEKEEMKKEMKDKKANDGVADFTEEQLRAMEVRGTTTIKCRDGVVRHIKDGKIVANEDEAEDVEKPTEVEAAPVKVEGSEITITASEYAEFKKAKEELANKQASETITSLVFNDKVGFRMPTESKEALVSFYLQLNENMRTEFINILEQLPAAKIFNEVGDSGTEQSAQSAYEAIGKRANEIEKEKGVNYGEALKLARREAPELAKLASEHKEYRRPAVG